ncbi:MAG: copper chaperone PCu(A)C [Cucumibacter sp.]
MRMGWVGWTAASMLLLAPFALAQGEVPMAAEDGGLMPVMIMAGELLIENPWTRATPSGAPAAGAYLRITNHGGLPERLIGGVTDAAGALAVHQMRMADGIMLMEPVAGGIEILPGETLVLAPGRLHLMLTGLTGAIAEGDEITIWLEFERAGEVEIEFPASAIGGGSPYSDGMGGSHAGDVMEGETAQ